MKDIDTVQQKKRAPFYVRHWAFAQWLWGWWLIASNEWWLQRCAEDGVIDSLNVKEIRAQQEELRVRQIDLERTWT